MQNISYILSAFVLVVSILSLVIGMTAVILCVWGERKLRKKEQAKVINISDEVNRLLDYK